MLWSLSCVFIWSASTALEGVGRRNLDLTPARGTLSPSVVKETRVEQASC